MKNLSHVFCLFFFYVFLVTTTATSHGVPILPDPPCEETRCDAHGPPIKFPFRLPTQPKRCGYPNFELYCSKTTNKTIIKLQPDSIELHVNDINYFNNSISVSDPQSCLPKLAPNLSFSETSTFHHETQSYTLVNCTSTSGEESYLEVRVPCLSDPGKYDVYALYAYRDIADLPLAGCTKMYTEDSAPEQIFELDEISLTWYEPDCSSCEAKNLTCGFENYSIGTKVKCSAPPKDTRGIWTAVEVSGSIFGSLILLAMLVWLYRVYSADKKEKENQKRIENFLEDYKALKPARYTYADLKRITNEFKEKLGQGAYGTVYKGKLSSEIFVAAKILNSSTGNGEEFINEVGTMGRIHHVNVVRLVGFCADGCRRALVYEFLPNDSLEKFIFSNDGQQHSLGWEKLQDIALGIARGIEYLHQGCDQRILHFDIKPHNILLDEGFTPKISDFGLAKLCAKDQSAVSMTAARGTMGYIAPEVFSRNFGNVSHKSDVYSFGMLLLEMVGGRKNKDDTVDKSSQVFFPEWIYSHMEQGEELMIRLEEAGDPKIGRKLTIVGLWCIQWYPGDRPSMNVVVQMLEGEGDDLTMPPNPFLSTGHKRVDGGIPGRRLHQVLEIISEAEIPEAE